ncbi:MAG: hypothetical protein EBY21_15345 [Alphaproteobacteria bacterium]|nr:hypothetical protein [Alphaproteobacteria bacterium]
MASEPENPKPAEPSAALASKLQRQAAERRRLAEALRENLKRRKMQARVRRQSAIEEADLDEKP